MTAPQRVVLDTNVVVSALVFGGGAAGQIRHVWRQGLCVPLVSRATVEELIRVLGYPKFRLSAEEQHELLADYLPYAHAAVIPQPPPNVPPCRDADDLKFLELAIAGRARALVTGDADLLAVTGLARIDVVTPAQWLARMIGNAAPM